MALAFLMSNLLQTVRGIKIADNPAYGAMASIIDHQLRDGSTKEAQQVAANLRRFDMKATVTPITWKAEKLQGLDPKTLPNVEGLARTYRYRVIGNVCNYMGATSLFFAHHRDDQYETVLMRMLGGHGYRGLQGIREVNSIPECYDMHGVYKSGLLDDQLQSQPALSFRPANREIKRLRNIFRDEKVAFPSDYDRILAREQSLVEDYDEYGRIVVRDVHAPYLKPLDTEVGGVMIYRPLLGFDKDRLVATCEQNKIPWFEDSTNADPTLTTRNALRYLVNNHELPKALQKSSILALAERSKRRVQLEEAEAHRYLVREAIIKDFDPNAGTLLVNIPKARLVRRRRKRRSLCPYNKFRRKHRKIIMSIAIRKLMDFITPEVHLPSLANLENVVNRLYPHLSSEKVTSPPKVFVMAGILFDPTVSGNSIKWLLSRSPYPSNKPLPFVNLPAALDHRLRPSKRELVEFGGTARCLGWRKAKMFDGRFWIRIGYNGRNTHFRVQPFQPEDAKGFRKTLSPMRRARLERLLKHYAPGKIRYTLPALYSVERTRDHYSLHVTRTFTLLALPTLGIHIQGLERWVRYEARYRNVDTTLLGHEPRGEMGHVTQHWSPPYGAARNKRRRRMYKYREGR